MTDYEVRHAYDTVTLHARGGALKIELNRPESMNAWNRQLGLDLLDAVRTAAEDDAVRAVMLTGAGRGFSSGADLKDVSTDDVRPGDGRPDLRAILTERYHPIITTVRTMPKPVVAAVNGPAVGIGLSLALSADLVLAAESAYFLLAFVNIGLVPDGGASALVTARVGHTRASELAMLGERLAAPRALEWGLVNQVVPDAELAVTAEELVDRLAAGPTRSYAGVKRQLNGWLYQGLDAQLALEAEVQGEMAGSDDFAEGVLAFLQKRAASFTGS